VVSRKRAAGAAITVKERKLAVLADLGWRAEDTTTVTLRAVADASDVPLAGLLQNAESAAAARKVLADVQMHLCARMVASPMARPD
jgi:antitoxin component of RelBE/YafQ-DinJ toxin-antitoxin module